MAKEWFQHDYGTRNKKKLAVLIHEEGARGYGLFWIIVEMLYEAGSKKLELDGYTYMAIKKESGEDVGYIQEFIKKCLEVYKVFKKVGRLNFSTIRVIENDKHRKEISKKNSASGRKGGESRSNNLAVAKRNNSSAKEIVADKSRVEESKVEEKREEREQAVEPPKILEPVLPAPEGRANDLSKSFLFRKPNIPTWEKVFEAFVSAGGTEEMAKQFFDKHEGTGWFVNGSPIVNYVALAQKFIRNWNDNQQKSKPEEKNKPLPGHQPYEIL